MAPLRSRGEVRVFYHLYRQARVDNPRSGESGVLDPGNYAFLGGLSGELEDPAEVFAARSSELARLRGHGDAYGDDGASLGNLFLQLHSLEQVTRLGAAFDPEVFVFARPDVVYHDRLKSNLVRYVSRHPRTCAVPGWQWWHGGYNDRFAVCGRLAYRSYGERMLRAEAFCGRGRRPLHSENLLRFSLEEAAIKVAAMPLRFSRVRIDGTVNSETDDRRWTVLKRTWRARLRYLRALLGFF